MTRGPNELARNKNVALSQLTLAWLLHQDEDIVPIPGTTHTGRLRENLDAAEIVLTPGEVATISAISSPAH